jgi:xanthine/uracil permease
MDSFPTAKVLHDDNPFLKQFASQRRRRAMIGLVAGAVICVIGVLLLRYGVEHTLSDPRNKQPGEVAVTLRASQPMLDYLTIFGPAFAILGGLLALASLFLLATKHRAATD